MDKRQQGKRTSKDLQLDQFRTSDRNKKLTTNQGLKMAEDEHSLTVGERGPTLMEDFHFREKMTHFDHERIPERVVHARGFAAHGEFEAYQSMEKYTKADFLSEKGKKTPVFVRFSTVVGQKGSTDIPRDVRGFATKFYTEEGNYDLVSNNMPIFFIQDGIKFPDLVHSIKPEPHNEIPQATGAHDTFWDFVVNNQETANQVMWLMSPRALPRSFRMMEGFSINTFRFVNAEGKSRFVRFKWMPVLGLHSFEWDEAQKISGNDPDYNRRDLWMNIEMGNYPEFELGVQVIEEKDEFKFDFDILDATKFWPEEEIPVKVIGKMTLNRNVDNYFSETEQVAFHPGHVVPGIDFSNDPLLQGRLFSYTDTQLIRLGGPNFHEIPINRPVCPFHNNQRDGYHRQTINVGKVAYNKNSLADGTPAPASEEEGGYVHYQEKVEGRKVRARSESFKDFFSQARMFWNSLADFEKNHIIEAFSFEVGKVQNQDIRQQVIEMFAKVDKDLMTQVAKKIGATPPTESHVKNNKKSPAVSMANTVRKPQTRRAGIIVGEGFDGSSLGDILDKLKEAGITADFISERQGTIKGQNGYKAEANHTFTTTHAVLYDGIIIAGGSGENQSKFKMDASEFINDTFKHYKTIGVTESGNDLFAQSMAKEGPGIVMAGGRGDFANSLVDAFAQYKHYDRKF
ncbi:catalase [Bhargavaea ginsengi]|uniref:Catalase n=1 Tax=Bhargavaea ginsengi TaxID=426757 RepID=A0A1H6YAR8_9BACL|nr:catalase [Bhargavaea ginsengi]SEJ34240.1 catalase [Bhargavaea ginsengi]